MQDAELLFSAVREAGALALKLSMQGVRNWNKPDGSDITEADLQVDAFLKARLHGARPSYGWLSEETPDDEKRLNCSKLWIVDPIDGTRSFVNRTDEWCVVAALVEDGRPIMAVVFRPAANEFYSAIKGQGAFCNGLALKASEGELLGASLLGRGRALKALPGVVASSTPNIPLLLRAAYVAAGRADIALSLGLRNDWDLAAGDLLVHEAGGRMSQADGSDMIYNRPSPKQNGMVAAGIKRHRAVLAQLEGK